MALCGIGHIGDMDQATAVYDDHDQQAFTIFKERRIEKLLARLVGDHRGTVLGRPRSQSGLTGD